MKIIWLINGGRKTKTVQYIAESRLLFDLENDPGEQHNIAAQHAGIVDQLTKKASSYNFKKVNKTIP